MELFLERRRHLPVVAVRVPGRQREPSLEDRDAGPLATDARQDDVVITYPATSLGSNLMALLLLPAMGRRRLSIERPIGAAAEPQKKSPMS